MYDNIFDLFHYTTEDEDRCQKRKKVHDFCARVPHTQMGKVATDLGRLCATHNLGYIAEHTFAYSSPYRKNIAHTTCRYGADPKCADAHIHPDVPHNCATDMR